MFGFSGIFKILIKNSIILIINQSGCCYKIQLTDEKNEWRWIMSEKKERKRKKKDC